MIFSAALSMLLTSQTMPVTGWLDRIESRCIDCRLSVLSGGQWRGGECTRKSKKAAVEVKEQLQGLGSDLFGWQEYVGANGNICVHLTSPEDTWLSVVEAELFLGVMHYGSAATAPDRLTVSDKKKRRDEKPAGRAVRITGMAFHLISPAPSEEHPRKTMTLQAVIEASGRRVGAGVAKVYWVDDDFVLLGTGPTLTLTAKTDPQNREYHMVCLGLDPDGPYGACNEYTVTTNKAGEALFDSFGG